MLGDLYVEKWKCLNYWKSQNIVYQICNVINIYVSLRISLLQILQISDLSSCFKESIFLKQETYFLFVSKILFTVFEVGFVHCTYLKIQFLGHRSHLKKHAGLRVTYMSQSTINSLRNFCNFFFNVRRTLENPVKVLVYGKVAGSLYLN